MLVSKTHCEGYVPSLSGTMTLLKFKVEFPELNAASSTEVPIFFHKGIPVDCQDSAFLNIFKDIPYPKLFYTL